MTAHSTITFPIPSAQDQTGLADALVLVTGGTRGLGRTISERLAGAAARVVCVARDVKHVNDMGIGAVPVIGCEPCDISNPEDVSVMIQRVENHFGPIDAMVCNAGIHLDGRFDRQSSWQWNQVIGTNLLGTANCLRAVLPGMRRRRSGRIVMVSSILGCRVMPGASSYCVSKAAINMLIRCTAAENGGSGIRINGVAPGYVETGMGREVENNIELHERVSRALVTQRFAHPHEVADCVSFLLSNQASYINGEIIEVSGGVHDFY